MADEADPEKGKSKQSFWHAVYQVSDAPNSCSENRLDINGGDISEYLPKKLLLLTGNMTAEEESSLRNILMSKVFDLLKKNDSESFINSQDTNDIIENTPTQLYCKGIFNRKSKSLEYLACFVSATKSGLELFQEDLDKFSSKLLPRIEKYIDTGDTKEYLKEAEIWWFNVVTFVQDCLELFDYDLATLLCAGFCGDTVNIGQNIDKQTEKNILRFLNCCNLSILLVDDVEKEKLHSDSLKDLVSLQNPQRIEIFFKDGSYNVTPRKPSTFCNDCIRQLKANQAMDPIQMRQMIENFKLKSIQDLNTFRRLLTQAEVDFYACFRTFLFLVSSGNGLTLMKNSRLQSAIEHASKRHRILEILQQFIDNNGGFGVFDTKEKKEQLNNKMGQLRFN